MSSHAKLPVLREAACMGWLASSKIVAHPLHQQLNLETCEYSQIQQGSLTLWVVHILGADQL